MAGLVPAIHIFEIALVLDVDARHKAGHDGQDVVGLGTNRIGVQYCLCVDVYPS
jgi:hypothetical protein